MIETIREGEDIRVLISGKEVDILDAGDEFVLAECDLDDLAAEAAGPFPADLHLELHSSDGFGT